MKAVIRELLRDESGQAMVLVAMARTRAARWLLLFTGDSLSFFPLCDGSC